MLSSIKWLFTLKVSGLLCPIMSAFIIFWPHGAVFICVDAHFKRRLMWLKMHRCVTVFVL